MQLKHLWQNLVCNTDKSWDRVRQIVINRDHHVCRYCGKFDANGEVDHILPLKKGGMDAIYNLAWACKRCNLSKGDKTILEWVSYLIEHERKDVLKQISEFLNCYEHQKLEMETTSLSQIPRAKNCETVGDLVDAQQDWLKGTQDLQRMHEVISYLRSYALKRLSVPQEVLAAFDYFETLMAGLDIMLVSDQLYPERVAKIRQEIRITLYHAWIAEAQPRVDIMKDMARDCIGKEKENGKYDLMPGNEEAIFDIVETAIEADGFDGTQLSLFPRNGKNRDGTS